MFKIMLYEIRRFVFSKIYAALLAITLVFSYYILSNNIIMGTDFTAPFSKWSYSFYLCSVLPFLVVAILFFCTYVFSKKEYAVRTITLTTRMTSTVYYLSKAAAILLAYLITLGLVILLSFIFYASVFSFWSFQDFLDPILCFSLAPSLFFLGLGILAGFINGALIYAVMIASFILGSIGGLLGNIGLFCKKLLQDRPSSIAADASGEVPFILPDGFTASRIIWAAVGIAMFVLVCVLSNKKIKE